MRQMRTAAILFAVLLGLGAIATWDEEQTEQEAKEAKTKNPLFTLNFSDVTEVRYQRTTGGEETELVDLVLQKDDVWRLVKPIQEKADLLAVQNFLKALQDYHFVKVISSDPTKFEEYGVGERADRRITLVSGDQETTLIVGSDAPIGYQAYLRLEGTNEVLLGSQHVRVLTHKTLFDFRDKAVVDMPMESVESVTLETRNKDAIRFERRDDVWTLTNPVEAPADKDEVQDFLGGFKMVRAAGFYDAVGDAMRADLVDPDYRITFVLENDEHKGMSVTNHGGKLVGSFDINKGAFVLPDNLRTTLGKTLLDFRDRRVLKIDANKVTQVEVDGDSYVRKEGVWYNAQGSEATHLQALVVDLEFAKTDAFIEWTAPQARNLSPAPQHRLQFMTEENEPVIIDLYENKEVPNTYFVKRHGAPFLYQIAAKEFDGMKPLVTGSR